MTNNLISYKRYKYRFSPLVETIFEVKFSDDQFDSATPGQVYEKIRNEYPTKKGVHNLVLAVAPASTSLPTYPPPFRTPQLQAWNSKNSQCLQVGPGIITANDRNYQDWEHFLPAIRLVTGSYLNVACPKTIERIGLRYINRIVIPADTLNVSQYFQVGISAPSALTNTYAFDMTLHNQHPAPPQVLTKVRFASDTLKKGESGVAFILDIDAYTTDLISTTPDDIIAMAHTAHDHVGYIFESILQDDTRRVLGGVEE